MLGAKGKISQLSAPLPGPDLPPGTPSHELQHQMTASRGCRTRESMEGIFLSNPDCSEQEKQRMEVIIFINAEGTALVQKRLGTN